MKKYIFSGLIFCGGLLAAAQTMGQSFAGNGNSVNVSTADPSGLIAYPENNNIVVLRWRSGNETNVDHFVIERSTDSIHFDPLHELVSRGAIDRDSSYQDEDNPNSRINYYRLGVVDKDGNSSYSPAVRVDLPEQNKLVLKPTVLTMGGTLRLDAYHEQPLTINIFNERGTLMGSYMVNSTSFDISTSGWGKGIYIYRISDARHPLIDAGKIMVL